MSLSKECQEYHLTPRGWIEGSFKGDVLGGKEEVATPKDRVLTILCYDERTSIHSEPFFYDRVAWKAEDEDIIIRLQKRFGKHPDWFGYNMMNKQ